MKLTSIVLAALSTASTASAFMGSDISRFGTTMKAAQQPRIVCHESTAEEQEVENSVALDPGLSADIRREVGICVVAIPMMEFSTLYSHFVL